MKKVFMAAVTAAALTAGGLGVASANTPAAADACMDGACAISISSDPAFAGQEVVFDYQFATGETAPLAVFAVEFAESDDPFVQGAVTSLQKVTDSYTPMPGTGTDSIHVPSHLDGSDIIIGPEDLTLATVNDAIPAAVGGSRISTRQMRSSIGRDVGINIGADFYTVHEDVTIDVADLSDPAKNNFASIIGYGISGDSYNIEANFGGDWAPIGMSGQTALVDYDDNRRINSNGTATVYWTIPTDVEVGTYAVRWVNESAGIDGAYERLITVTGDTDPGTDPTGEPTEDPTGEPTDDPTGEPTEDPTGEPTTDPTGEPTDDPTTAPTSSGQPTTVPTNPAPAPGAGGTATPTATAPVDSVYYEDCDAVHAAGKAPILPGDPGWQKKFDRNNNGVGCEVTSVGDLSDVDDGSDAVGLPGSGV